MRAIFPFLLCLLNIVFSHAENSTSGDFDSTGVLSIDTLKNFEWDIPIQNQNKTIGLAWGLLPGGTQIYSEHYVRAGFLIALEAYLISEVFYNSTLRTQKYQTATQQWAQKSAPWLDSLTHHPLSPLNNIWRDSLGKNIKQMRRQADATEENKGLLKSQQAWLFGLHLYGFMDGFGILLHNERRKTAKLDPKIAVLSAILAPGFGQIYNDQWGKAGLLWMSFIGSYASFNARQQTVEYYLKRYQTAFIEGNSSDVQLMSDKVTFFRKKRNQYIWAPFLFYLYSIGDAAVDATLSDFDAPQNDKTPKLSLMPFDDGLQFQLSGRF